MGEVVKSKVPFIYFIRQAFLTASVTINIIGHGCVIGFPAILIPSLRRPESHIQATPSEESWIASIVGCALIAGNFIVTPMMDSLGRKTSHLATMFPMLTGWFILVLGSSVTELIAARFLQGISMGMLGPLGSIIIGEMTDPKNRGVFLTSVSLALTLGVLCSHALGTYFSWQQTALICSFISFTSLCLIIYTPESPSWLISKGRIDEGSKVFRWLRGTNDEQEEELEHFILAQKMIRKASITDTNKSTIQKVKRYFRFTREASKKPEFYKPISIMVLMYTMFQFAGINVISSYAIDIIKLVVGKDANANLLMVCLDIERLLCNILALVLVKNLKRRTLLFSNALLCVVAYFGKALYVYANNHNLLPFHSQIIPITLIGMYMFSLTVGISSLTFTLSGEIFPLEYRGLGGGISVLALSMNFFIAVKSFPVLWNSIGLPITYCIYSSMVILCSVFMWFMLPETKDRTLQDIEDTFRGKPADKSKEPLNGMGSVDLGSRRGSTHIIY